MSSWGFRERILEVFADGSAVGNTVTETSILPTSAFASVGAYKFDRPGTALAFKFSGRISNRVTGPDTIRFKFYFGSIAVFDSGLIPLNVVAKTNVPWTLEGELIARAVGNGTIATLFPKDCQFTSESVIGSPAATAGGNGVLLLPFNTAPVVGAGFDNSASQLMDLKVTHSVANASNTITLHAGNVDIYT